MLVQNVGDDTCTRVYASGHKSGEGGDTCEKVEQQTGAQKPASQSTITVCVSAFHLDLALKLRSMMHGHLVGEPMYIKTLGYLINEWLSFRVCLYGHFLYAVEPLGMVFLYLTHAHMLSCAIYGPEAGEGIYCMHNMHRVRDDPKF